MNVIPKALRTFSKLFIYSLSSFFVFFLFVQCTTNNISTDGHQNPEYILPGDFEWIQLANPVSYYKYEHTASHEKLIYHLVKVELDDPAIQIGASDFFIAQSYETIGQTTKNYVRNSGAFFAINASPFSYPFGMFSAKRSVVGLYIYENFIVSQPEERYAALYFTENKQAFIANSQLDVPLDEAYFAFGGFWTILQDETIYQFQPIKDARTAVGISEDGFTAYILCTEKNMHSTGLTFMDCAYILQSLGAKTAIQLDGGNSVNLVFKDFPEYSVTSSRKVANNIGFFIGGHF